jgi:predicted DNA binding CopG/RHH family protein
MNKNIFLLVAVFSLILVIPMSHAQLTIGGNAEQKLIEMKLDIDGTVSVKHVVSSSNMPVTVQLFSGTISNLVIINEKGEDMFENGANAGIAYDPQGNQSIVIFPSKQNSIIEYNLESIIPEDNLLTIQTSYAETYSVIFSDEIEMIFLNNNIIFLENKKGVSLNYGGSATIQYYSNTPKIIKEVQWEENEFDVEIITDSKIDKFNFEQTSKSISFQVNEEDKLVTIIMSEELLGGPYLIFLDDEKIKFNKTMKNENNIVLNIKPEVSGEIVIIGTTVIPEFSMFIPLIMGFFIILTMPLIKKINLH